MDKIYNLETMDKLAVACNNEDVFTQIGVDAFNKINRNKENLYMIKLRKKLKINEETNFNIEIRDYIVKFKSENDKGEFIFIILLTRGANKTDIKKKISKIGQRTEINPVYGIEIDAVYSFYWMEPLFPGELTINKKEILEISQQNEHIYSGFWLYTIKKELEPIIKKFLEEKKSNNTPRGGKKYSRIRQKTIKKNKKRNKTKYVRNRYS
jgi:hypothetical protein